MSPAGKCLDVRTLRTKRGGVGIDLGGGGEPAASLMTEYGQPVHEQRVADEVDLLA